jgi:hypothetical protein
LYDVHERSTLFHHNCIGGQILISYTYGVKRLLAVGSAFSTLMMCVGAIDLNSWTLHKPNDLLSTASPTATAYHIRSPFDGGIRCPP